MAVSKRLRYEVLRRDNFACRYCGAKAPDVVLVVDHVLATALGGEDVAQNLAAACESCNSGKSATPVDAAVIADVEQEQLRWMRAMELARRWAETTRDDRNDARAEFREHWTSWGESDGRGGRVPMSLPLDWTVSFDRFLDYGLGRDDLLDAIEQTMAARGVYARFNYFCSIAWRLLRERQDLARALIESDGDL